MKTCDQFKELILTDYIDGELDKEAAGQLESHLLDCGDCRAFFKEVKTNTSLPFQNAAQQPVPAVLWERIKQGIDQEDQPSRHWENIIEHLKGLIVFPRMVPILASLVLMLLVGSVSLKNIQIQRVQDKDQGEYLVSLLGSTSAPASSETNDLGTPIEHYFL